MTTIYVTKYALTEGVLRIDAEIDPDGRANAGQHMAFRPSEYAQTESYAAEQFDNLRKRKIASLNKQLKKLESMKFKIKDHK